MITVNKTLIIIFLVFILGLFDIQYIAKYSYAVPGGIPGICNSIARITKQSDLSFGAMLVDYAGTISIDTNDSTTTTGGVSRFGGAISTARFQVRGCPDKVYSIVLPTQTTLNTAAASMNVDNFISNPAVGLLDPNGNQNLAVGARLNISTSQAPGDYTGSFAVEVIFE